MQTKMSVFINHIKLYPFIVIFLGVVWKIEAQSTEAIIQKSLDGAMDYSDRNKSFSPFYSDIGLGFKEGVAGIDEFYLHYNRQTTAISNLLTFEAEVEQLTNNVLSVSQKVKEGKCQYAFYDRNSFVVEGSSTIDLHLGSIETSMNPRISAKENMLIYNAYLPTRDGRDPDKFFPFILGLKVLKGELVLDEEGKHVKIEPLKNGNIYVAISANMLEVEEEKINTLLEEAPQRLQGALDKSSQWLKEGLGEISFGKTNAVEEKILSTALVSLLFNSSKAPGNLAGYISQFPSRGGYPTHFLWDACFHNLALDYMHPDLSKDAILLLLKNLRVDGKMAHFLCSTWTRPQDSQPPLVGWAALRLVNQRNDLVFAREILPDLIKNTNWWLSQRMTDTGLIMTLGPYETGWDNTPRFDKGQVISTDMNTYLWLQINACKELAKLIGDEAIAVEMEQLETVFGQKMVEVLFDEGDGLFYDVLLETGEFVKAITPANFIPLLADLPISNGQVEAMIDSDLLSEEKMFGKVPFPSLAYDEPEYKPQKWWRGPTWLAPAYLCLEVLKKHGYKKERKEAATKLYDMIVADGRISELFNSQTGEGLGNAQQGWTAAILLKLKMEVKPDER